MSFKLSATLLKTLGLVRDGELGVSQAFDFLSEKISEEFDDFEQEIRKEYKEED
jgi:hypothetical protein